MRLKDVYINGRDELIRANISDAYFDAILMFEHCFGLDRQGLIINGNQEADKRKEELYFSLIRKRVAGIPLQYIIGYWHFMDLKFYVGEGVLIPRQDTEVLVRETISHLNYEKEIKILDLCSGSGAVGISIAANIRNANVFCVEVSKEAYRYLEKNIELNKTRNVTALNKDIFDIDSILKTNNIKNIDAIVANPPYISLDEMDNLQKEVKKEPYLALYGGKDGLRFYRFILTNWANVIKKGGLLALEIGASQGKSVYELFVKNGMTDVKIIKDLNGMDRVVMGTKL